MEDVGNFVWTVVASSVGTTVLLGVAASLFRTQITHWLTKDLEALKAKHQQDLETYKVGLIAEAERAKASQAVKTAMALRSADLQFATLELLQRTLMAHASRASAFMRAEMNTDRFNAEFKSLNAALADATQAIRSAGLFLAKDDIDRLYELQYAYVAAIGAAWENDGALPEEDAERLEADLFAAQWTANGILRHHLSKMLDMS